MSFHRIQNLFLFTVLVVTAVFSISIDIAYSQLSANANNDGENVSADQSSLEVILDVLESPL